MKILSIETSCDETALTILEAKGTKSPSFKVLANSVASQINIHKQYGGVYPMMAKREHIKNLPILLEKILKEAKLNKKVKPVDLVVVTSGPGLEPALWTGIVFAKDVAKKWNTPLLPINHMQGHILSVFGKTKGEFSIPSLKFPIMSLLVSGGHTELALTKDWTRNTIIGATLDDAVGEAFDKVARMLDLPYPGGPEISKLAEKERIKQKEIQSSRGLLSATGAKTEQFSSKKIVYPEKLSPPFVLPRPMLYSKNFDFSFSGLKTAVLYLIRDLGKLNQDLKEKIALEFENAATETLVHKTNKAIEKYGVKTLIVAGGVSANKHLKKEMKKSLGKKVEILFPAKGLTTDNSIMIGMAGYLEYLKKKGKVGKGQKIKAEGNLKLK